jgi:5-hydroxyisourate hydrolase-like protein (transthyretin family)
MTFGSIGAAEGAKDPSGPKLDASKSRVGPGARVTLRGQFPERSGPEPVLKAGEQPAPESDRVRIQFRPAGKDFWRKAKTTTTDRDGRYVRKVEVKGSGRFRAVHADGRTTAPEFVRVESRLKARVGNENATAGETVPITGTVRPGGSRRPVTVRVDGDVLHTRTDRNGRFKVQWKAGSTGDYKVKVKAASDKVAAGSKDKAGKVTVFRPAEASWYGPGFYGNRTACGQTLSTSTVGVAHKTMPCGTKLTLRYKGREVDVKVIDRGPYSGDREFDLTSATKEKLGFGSTGTVLTSR